MKRKFFIKNKYGLNLAAIIEAPNFNNIFPGVLLLHGFKGYKEEKTYTDLANRLKLKGIASLGFDASGFGESEGTLEKDYRFSNYINDTESIYKWLKKQTYIDIKRIGVCGQSLGAVQTIFFTAHHPEIKAVCAISPPDRIGTKDRLGQIASQWKKQGYIKELSSKYGTVKIPYAYLEDAKKYNFIKVVKLITCPILFIIGKKDITVPPEQTKFLYQAANYPKKKLEFAEMDHFYKRNKRILAEINEKVVDFFVKNLSM